MKKDNISISVLMPRDRHPDLVAAAKKSGMSQAAFIRQATYEKIEEMAERGLLLLKGGGQ